MIPASCKASRAFGAYRGRQALPRRDEGQLPTKKGIEYAHSCRQGPVSVRERLPSHGPKAVGAISDHTEGQKGQLDSVRVQRQHMQEPHGRGDC